MKIFCVLLAVFALAFVSGCIKVDQTFILNADGSGTFDMSYSMSEQTIMQMESMAKMQMDPEGEEEGDIAFDFDEKSMREGLKKFEKDGVVVKSVSTVTKDGWKTMKIKLAFESLKGLSKTEFFEKNSVTIKKNESGDYVFMQKARNEKSGPGGVEMEPAMAQQMAPMLAGMRIVQHIKVPGRIISSNATETKESTASWIFDIDKDPAVFSKMMNLNMRIVFDGKGLDSSKIIF